MFREATGRELFCVISAVSAIVSLQWEKLVIALEQGLCFKSNGRADELYDWREEEGMREVRN